MPGSPPRYCICRFSSGKLHFCSLCAAKPLFSARLLHSFSATQKEFCELSRRLTHFFRPLAVRPNLRAACACVSFLRCFFTHEHNEKFRLTIMTEIGELVVSYQCSMEKVVRRAEKIPKKMRTRNPIACFFYRLKDGIYLLCTSFVRYNFLCQIYFVCMIFLDLT